jgi:outer membrane lipoprotein SlyB
MEILAWIVDAVLARLGLKRRGAQALVGMVASTSVALLLFFCGVGTIPPEARPSEVMPSVLQIVIFAALGGAIGGLIGASLMQDRGEQAQIICAAIIGVVTGSVLAVCWVGSFIMFWV